MDIILQIYLQKRIIPKFYNKDLTEAFDKVLSTYYESISYKYEDDEFYIFNTYWKLLSSIVFVDGIGTVILTGRKHTNGTNHIMIHTPSLKFHIPFVRYSDQLSASVL